MRKLTDDRMKWGRGAILAAVCLLVVFLLVRPCLWIRLFSATVSFDGRLASVARVYRSCDGELLVWLSEPEGGVPYVVVPSVGDVREGHGGSILDGGDYLVGALFGFNRPDARRHGYLRGVSLNSVKNDTDPHLVFRPGSVEFTSTVHGRVQIKL